MTIRVCVKLRITINRNCFSRLGDSIWTSPEALLSGMYPFIVIAPYLATLCNTLWFFNTLQLVTRNVAIYGL